MTQVTDLDKYVTAYDPTEYEGTEVKVFTLPLDGQPDIRFSGTLVGLADSCSHDEDEYENVEPSRWTTINLYKTVGGRYICHIIGETSYLGEVPRYRGKVCADIDAVKAYLGHNNLAKALYKSAGIDAVIEVE